MADDQEGRLRRLRRLSAQQRLVLSLRCQKRSLKEIAAELVIEERTVKYHMARIYAHLELDTLPPRVRPIELGVYCPLLSQLDKASPPARISPPEPEPVEQPRPGALRAVEEDELVLLSSPRPDIVIYPGRIPEPALPPQPRISRGMAITLLSGVVIIAALTGALIMSLLLRPAPPEPAVVSVVVTATPPPQPTAQLVVQVQPTAIPTAAPAPPTAPPVPPTAAPKPTIAPTSAPTNTVPAPTATRAPPTSTPQPPTPTPRPQPGDVIYEANWSNGLSGWIGSADWKVSNGMLLNDGTRRDSRIQAPLPIEVGDYSVEAEIQQPSGRAGWFLLFLRGNGDGGYTMGVDRDGYKMMWVGDRILTGSNQLAQKAFDPGTGWHTYRLEAKGNRLRVLVDGGVFLQATDNKYLSGGEVGLFADTAPLVVRKFRVVAE
jgi:DNA-binding CsgD family transcriptional regulator